MSKNLCATEQQNNDCSFPYSPFTERIPFMKYLHPSLFSLLLSLAPVAVAAQSTQTITKPEIVYSLQPRQYVLGGLVVDGVKGYDNDLLVNIADLEVGRTYAVPGDDISRAVQNYWKQGLFSNVQVEADSIVGDKIYLHFKLTAQPRISALRWNGLKKSQREELEQRVPLRVGNQVTPNLVDRTKLRIKKYFEEKGYKNVEVDVVQHEDVTADNHMIVDINVNKNDKILIRQIHITGVDEKLVNPLKNAMKKTSDRSTFKKWITFASRKFRPEQYEEDKGFLIDKMNSLGYRDALVVSDSVVPVDATHVDVYLHLNQGKQYYIRNIAWVGNTVYPSDALMQQLRIKKGDLYNQTLLNKRLNEEDDAIGKQYYNNGYVFYHLEPVETKVEGDSIDLEMRISEGKQAKFNRVRISGNDRVYDHVIRREIRTKPGDLFSIEALQRSVRELAATKQFDNEVLQSEIFKNIRPDESSGTVDITYPLVTKGSDQIEVSAGWGVTGIIGRASLKFTNFSMQNLFGRNGYKRAGFIPQGDGQTLQVSVQSNAKYYQNYSLSFIDPWFGGKRPNQLSVSAFFSRYTDVNSSYYSSANYYSGLYNYGTNSSAYNYASYYDPDKYMQMLGASIGFGKRLRWPDDYFSFSASLNYTLYSLKNWRYFLITNGVSNNVNLALTLARSSVTDPIFPRGGSDFSLSVAFTPPYSMWDGKNYEGLATNPQSGSYDREAQDKYRWIEYHKWSMKFRTYTALNSSLRHVPVIMTRTDFGILGAYNKHRKSPFETYYMGGDGMSGGGYGYASDVIALRGYENGAIAGNTGNNGLGRQNAYAYTRLTLELRYPLMLESTSIYALAFAEAGNAWVDINKMNPFKLKTSAGVGVRILLPMVGLMGIDWAYGFKEYEHGYKIGGSQFHFVLGQEF